MTMPTFLILTGDKNFAEEFSRIVFKMNGPFVEKHRDTGSCLTALDKKKHLIKAIFVEDEMAGLHFLAKAKKYKVPIIVFIDDVIDEYKKNVSSQMAFNYMRKPLCEEDLKKFVCTFEKEDTQADNEVVAMLSANPNTNTVNTVNRETQRNKRVNKRSKVWENFSLDDASGKAFCKKCKQAFIYNDGPKNHGTSNLQRHTMTCSTPLHSQDPNHRGNGNAGSSASKQGYDTIKGDCTSTYLKEKQKVMKYFDALPGRFCLTLDTWTSSQSVSYVLITGHFVDRDWKLQSRILNIVMEQNPDSELISHALAVCLSDWKLDVFSITCNQALSEGALGNIRSLLSLKNPLILNGQLVVENCIAGTLTRVANELLNSVQGTVKQIRDCVKFVKTSKLHEEKFMDLKQHLQVPSEKSLFIDDQHKWNTTYHMLVVATELKQVFTALDTSDADTDPEFKGAPSQQDWMEIESTCGHLKFLYDAATIFTTTSQPTASTFFLEVCELLSGHLTPKPMQEQVRNYLNQSNLILAIAVVMDPCAKMQLVRFGYNKIYGKDAEMHLRTVDDGVHKLFDEYTTLSLPPTPADDSFADFDAWIKETSNQPMQSELDLYLQESLFPCEPNFNVLGWWKLNQIKYPTLSKMARDILSVRFSSVHPDSVFDGTSTSKVIDLHGSSLAAATLQALVCSKDWMQYS